MKSGFLAICLFGALGLAYYGTRDGSSPAQVSNTGRESTIGVGDTYHASKDGWDIIVTEVRTVPAVMDGIFPVPHIANGIFLAVTVTQTNTGKSEHALGANRFTLHDQEGRKFDAETFEDQFTNDISFGRDINPGVSLKGVLSFDIPKDVNGLWVEVIGHGRIDLGSVSGSRFQNGSLMAQRVADQPPAPLDATSRGASPIQTTSPQAKTTSPASPTTPAEPAGRTILNGEWQFANTITHGPDTGRTITFTLQLIDSAGQITGGGSGLTIRGRRIGDLIQAVFSRDGGTGTFDWSLTNDGMLVGRFTDDAVGNGGTSSGTRIASSNRTSTPFVAQTILTVATPGDCLNVRIDPDPSAPIFICLKDGTRVRPEGHVQVIGGTRWVAVQIPDGRTGWASASYLR